MTVLLAGACVCVTCCSSMAGSTYAGMRADFGVGEEVCILSISLFVAGLGVGPRECLHRSCQFQADWQCSWDPAPSSSGEAESSTDRSLPFFCSICRSRLVSLALGWTALMSANNIAVHLIFRFWTGFAGSAFLTVSGGLISDTFRNEKVAKCVARTSHPGADVTAQC